MKTNFKFIDERDGREYKIIRIGNKLMTAENMCYRIEGCSYMYKDDFVSFEKNGYLYNQKALEKICPPGWHVATKGDFESFHTLVKSSIASMSLVQIASGALAEQNVNLQLAGLGSECMNDYFCEGDGAYFWTSSKDADGNPLFCNIDSQGIRFSKPEQLLDLFSVRLVYDDAFAPKEALKTPTVEKVDGPF